MAFIKAIGFFALIALALVAVFLMYSRATPTPALDGAMIKINGHSLMVEVVRTETERARGLGGHAPLSDDEGMLFVFPVPATQTFWMKDMAFPLDIVWLNGEGSTLTIVGIEENIDPQIGARDDELKLYSSPEPVPYVLEVRGGFMRTLGAEPGAAVELIFLL